MRIAIMQPYFLPYIGYFQLMRAVDTFVFYDDVTFIKQGWINRNRILLNDKAYLFTLELKGASSFKRINNIEIGSNRDRLSKTFNVAYKKAPYFNDLEPLLKTIFNSNENNLSNYIVKTHQLITAYLGIKTKLINSSEITKNNTLKGQQKVIEICKALGAVEYINSIGGQELYSKHDFLNEGIDLKFLKSDNIEYKQFNNNFVPSLSIIDVMMFNSVSDTYKMLYNYQLV